MGLEHGPCMSRSGVEYEIVVIDDASPDGTAEVVRALQQEYGEERIVRPLAKPPWR